MLHTHLATKCSKSVERHDDMCLRTNQVHAEHEPLLSCSKGVCVFLQSTETMFSFFFTDWT